MIFIQILNYDKICELGFPRLLSRQDSVQSSTANLKGAEKYLLCGIHGSLDKYVYNIHIPDINIPINVASMQMDFKLSEIKIANLQVPDLKMNLDGNEQIALYLPSCELLLSFQWKFQQQAYPYTTDNGSGQIIIKNGTMGATARSEIDKKDCPGHMILKLVKSQLHYDQLRIKLDGGASWIFQSLIDVILDSLQNQISGFLADTLMIGFVQIINNAFEDGRRQYNYTSTDVFLKDERYVDGVQIGNGFVSLLFSGYTYFGKNLTDEFLTKGTSQITFNKFNTEMQMAVKDEAFNNVFYIFHKYKDAFSTIQFKSIQHPTLRFTNTGALVTMLVEVNGSQIQVELIGQIKLFNDLKEETGKISFKYIKYDIQQVEGIDTELLQQQIEEYMNSISEMIGFQYNYTLMVDIRDFQAIYDANERVMRLVGDLPKECMPY
ncbi:Conserved_hypothetical protein [Hexamita inflata]|uniref:Lipid-binding serum glycoprotein N-terminal domain-containing protein n=1 Tax=Hexamita inflata TaxID=28002 RepID=A0AA86RLK2_9EUKA|nr:Conserved hypothetical protein [Hexamita inflata]